MSQIDLTRLEEEFRIEKKTKGRLFSKLDFLLKKAIWDGKDVNEAGIEAGIDTENVHEGLLEATGRLAAQHDLSTLEVCERVIIDSIENYLNDAMEYWTVIEKDDMQEALNTYNVNRRKKYHKMLGLFLEVQGFSLIFMWMYWRNTTIAPVFLKELAKKYEEFQKRDGYGILGPDDLGILLEDSDSWNEAKSKENKKAVREIQNRKKRQGDGAIHIPNKKRVLLKNMGEKIPKKHRKT